MELLTQVIQVEHLVNHVVHFYPEELEMRVALPYQKETQVVLTIQEPEEVVAVAELLLIHLVAQVVREH